MKIKIIFIFAVFIVVYLQSCETIIRAKLYNSINSITDAVYIDVGSDYNQLKIKEFNQSGKLYYFAKIWGEVKYRGITKKENIDDLLLSSLPNILNACDKIAFNKELDCFLDQALSKDFGRYCENLSERQNAVMSKCWKQDTLYFSNDLQNRIWLLVKDSLWDKSTHIKQSASGKIGVVNNLKCNLALPSMAIRMYALFDYWNIIDNFYVHKGIMGHNWDSVLYHTIPDFINCSDSVEYNKTILKLTALLNDTHVFTTSETIDNVIFGRNIPPFSLYRFDDRFYVDELYLKDFKTLQVGDEIKAINNIHTSHLYDSIKIYKGSSIDRKNGKVGWFIYSTPKDSISVSYIRHGIEKSVNIVCKNYQIITAEKTQDKNEKKQNYRIEKIKNGVSYFHVQYLTKKNVSKIIDDIGKNDTVIFDLRGYPEYGVSLPLVDFFIAKRSSFASTTYPDISKPGTFRIKSGNNYWKFRDSFNGFLIILVDGNTMSEAEYLTMALQKAKSAITVGSTTAGADGNVVYYTFPGNVHTSFTGIGIFYSDMTPTQRVGVKIDHYVEPTLDDIIKKRDPVLDFVVDSLLGK